MHIALRSLAPCRAFHVAPLLLSVPACEPAQIPDESTTVDAVGSSPGNAPIFLGEPHRIVITGSEFQWVVQYLGLDGVLFTEDDARNQRDVHVPAGTNVKLLVRSADYIYRFAVSHYDLKQIAVPDLEFSLNLRAEELGTFELRGDKMCGFTHPQLLGVFTVVDQSEYAAWIRRQRGTGDLVTPASAALPTRSGLYTTQSQGQVE